MTKHAPITTTASAVRIAQGARHEIRPPAHIPLDETELLHFNSIIAEKANSEWTAHEIDIAALFAGSMQQLGEQTRLMADEGSIVMGAAGHSVAKMPNASDRARRNALGREIQDGINGDDLIARPKKSN